MKYDHVSIYQAIVKVMRDLNEDETPQRIDDYIEWACEAIEEVGGVTTLEMVETGDMSISNYQCRRPKYLYDIDSVWYKPTEKSSYIRIYPSTSGRINPRVRTNSVKYIHKPGFIVTTAKDGFLKIRYRRLVLDESGMPMIPNVKSYLDAVYWYIVMKVTYPKWRMGAVKDSVYVDAKTSWTHYRNKAYGEVMMPTKDEMARNINNIWNRLVPRLNESDSDFEYIGEQEKIIL